jgi:mono/diheme cytochrome c family protein
MLTKVNGLNRMPTAAAALCCLILGAACAFAPAASAQMMGGNLMSGEHMRAMEPLMSWMQGSDITVALTEPQPEFSAELHARGKLLYGQHCAICHGDNGDGNGKRASELSPRPRNFTTGAFEFRTTPTGALPADEDIWRVISAGLHGTAMVPWITLTEHDRWALVAYVEGFSPRFANEKRAAPLAVPSPPAETPGLIAQGQKMFTDAGCVECHGATGHGDGPSTPSLKDAAGLPIRPLDFRDGILRHGSRLEDIFLTLRTGLNGTPMPSYADSLTPEQTWAVAAYVRSLIGVAADSSDAADARQQERLGMAIDMPGMAGMPMGGMMH